METSRKVLLVDGSPTQSARLCFILDEAGYTTSWAKSVSEAIDMAQRDNPDVILTDVNLSRFDGFELCRQVKAHSHLAAIPVVMATSLSEPSNIIRGLEAGTDGFLIRPHTDDDLFSQLDFACRNRGIREADSPVSRPVTYLGEEHQTLSSHGQVLGVLMSNYDCAARQGDSLRKQVLALSVRNKQLEVENEQLKARDLTVSQELSERSPQTQQRVQQLMKFLEAVTKERDDFLKDLHAVREASASLKLQIEHEKIQFVELQEHSGRQETALVQMRQEYLAVLSRLEIMEIEQLELFEYIHALTGERPAQSSTSLDKELADLREQHKQTVAEASRVASRLAGAEWKLQLRDDRIQELESELVKLCGQLGSGSN
jgi:DNA-binding response OmpR family regulator